VIGRGATGELTGPDPEGSVPSTTHGETQFDQEREELVMSELLDNRGLVLI
jgi:hypothetical protein